LVDKPKKYWVKILSDFEGEEGGGGKYRKGQNMVYGGV
jgi:hypothetical protein